MTLDAEREASLGIRRAVVDVLEAEANKTPPHGPPAINRAQLRAIVRYVRELETQVERWRKFKTTFKTLVGLLDE